MPSYRALCICLSGRTIEKGEREREREQGEEGVVFDIDSISSIHLSDKLFSSSPSSSSCSSSSSSFFSPS